LAKFVLTDSVRSRLRSPFGQLLRGSYSQNRKRLRRIVETEKPPAVICVGDRVAKTAKLAAVRPALCVVDGKEMRKNTRPTTIHVKRIFRVRNEPGTIGVAAWTAIKDALHKRCPSVLLVEGEEDLLALPAILESSERTMVLYGQPNAGLVVVRVNRQKKNEASTILDSMRTIFD